jgi:predicted component of type VI protein secretion system
VHWQAGGEQGTFTLADGPVVIGRSDRCDLRVACRGPKHHLFIGRNGRQYEVRNTSWWYQMRVNGDRTSSATLRDGDEIVIGELRLTFKDDLR